jgi:hypothetical protein
MKRLSVLAAAAALSLASPAYAAEVEDAAACKMYSQFAATMVDFMLPLTLQDFVNMMSGKDPEALAEMSSGLITQLDQGDIKTMLALGDEAQIAGQAAGEVAMQILMTGQATSSSEVKNIMDSHCIEIGFDQILANQKTANRASAGNIAK